MSTTLVLPQPIASRLFGAQQERTETGAVLLASVAEVPDGSLRLLGREVHFVPEHGYAARSARELDIVPAGYLEALRRGEEIGATALWVHTHVGSDASTRPSRKDGIVDGLIEGLFRDRTGSAYYGTVIVGCRTNQPAFSGTLATATGRSSIDRFFVVGDHLALLGADQTNSAVYDEAIFDRSIRAFGGDVQRVLGELSICVVGCGGTGSAVAEQLVRLGVRNLTLVDPEDLALSNVTRVYGSTPTGVGRGKAVLLARYLRRVAPAAHIDAVKSTVTRERTARRLVGSDLVFGCTDDNAGRLVLSRLSSYYLVPVIDCGVVLTSDENGGLRGIDGRVTIMSPGSACLVCRGRVDLTRAASEMLTADERARLRREGYAPALPGVEPAVVAFTSMVASVAVSELIERLVGYGDSPSPSEILLRIHDREISTNVATPSDGHYCSPSAGKLGAGDTSPFLEQTWIA